MAEVGKKSPRAYRGEKKEKKFVVWRKKNGGWRISPAKNGHVRNVQNSPYCKTEKRQRREKNALGPLGEEKRKKIVIWKKKFFVGCKNKMLVGKKTCRLGKKMSVGEFPLPKTDMSGMSGIPCNARPKNGRGGKKTP